MRFSTEPTHILDMGHSRSLPIETFLASLFFWGSCCACLPFPEFPSPDSLCSALALRIELVSERTLSFSCLVSPGALSAWRLGARLASGLAEFASPMARTRNFERIVKNSDCVDVGLQIWWWSQPCTSTTSSCWQWVTPSSGLTIYVC